jgi:hypothetical protein
MMTAKKTEQKNIYYVGIEDPTDFRRELLSSAKGIIISLKKYERIKDNRIMKVKLFSQLQVYIKEINVLMKKLDGYLPETKLRHLPVEKQPIKKTKSKKESKAEEKKKTEEEKPKKLEKPVREYTELEKLEKELSMIENKLKTI